MKTPREILLARHRAAEPKLDAIREAVVAGANTTTSTERSTANGSPAGKAQAGFSAIFLTLWRELILPSRRAWSGLVTVWILIALVNLAQSKSPAGAATKEPARSEMAASYIEQQKMLGELLTDRTPVTDADRPKTFSPKPHTEAAGFKMV